MEKVLVTGAGGFIGHTVVARLAKMSEYEVTAVISGRHPVAFPDNVRVETADLLNEAAREALMERIRPEIMLHYAWGTGSSDYLQTEKNIWWLETSLHLCRLFLRHNGRRFLFAGSSTEYGAGFLGYSESMQDRLRSSLYGSCKLSLEQTAGTLFKHHGVGFASARYFTVYGPGDSRRWRPFIEAMTGMLEGKPFLCRAPNNIWDHIYIDDAVEATVRLMRSDYCGPMNIASGQPMTMRQVFSVMADVICRPNLLTFDENQPECLALTADVSQMESVLSYRCATPFRVGLAKTIQWWREQLNIPEE